MLAIKRNMKDQILTDDKKILHCLNCNSEFSGNAGDYWDLPDNHIFTCGECGGKMKLITKNTTITYV